MPNHGKGGRPKGSLGKARLERERMLAERGMTSLQLLQEVYSDPSKPWPLRVSAANSALPYEFSKLPVTARIESESKFHVSIVDYRDLPQLELTAHSVLQDAVVREMLDLDAADETPPLTAPKPLNGTEP